MDETDFDDIEGHVTLDADYPPEEEVEEFEESPLEYADAVEMFMTSLGQVRFALQDPNDLRCQLCIEDPSVADEDKEHDWVNRTRLLQHQEGRSTVCTKPGSGCKRSNILRAHVGNVLMTPNAPTMRT